MFFIGLIILAALAVIGIYLHYSFISLLKEAHHEKWKDLGSPALVANNTVGNNIAVLNFLRKKEYLEINDLHIQKES